MTNLPNPGDTTQLREDLATLAHVGRLYLDAIDTDPDHQYLTLGEALRVTDVRDAVERHEARQHTSAPETHHKPDTLGAINNQTREDLTTIAFTAPKASWHGLPAKHPAFNQAGEETWNAVSFDPTEAPAAESDPEK